MRNVRQEVAAAGAGVARLVLDLGHSADDAEAGALALPVKSRGSA